MQRREEEDYDHGGVLPVSVTTVSVPVPEHFRESCIVTPGLFSKEECDELRNRMHDQPLKIDTTSSESTLRIVERTSLNVSLLYSLF